MMSARLGEPILSDRLEGFGGKMSACIVSGGHHEAVSDVSAWLRGGSGDSCRLSGMSSVSLEENEVVDQLGPLDADDFEGLGEQLEADGCGGP